MQFSALAMGIASLVGAGTAVAGQVMAGQAQAKQGREMAAAEDINARIARQNAEAIKTAGQYEIDKQRDENRRYIGRQRALMAKSGVRFTGSPLDVMSDTIANQEMDIAAMNYDTQIASMRAMSQAQQSAYRSGVYGKTGQIMQDESLFKAGSTLLSEGANWANKYAGAFKWKAPSMTKVG